MNDVLPLLLPAGIPVAFAVFCLLMPSNDRIALRWVGMAGSILGGVTLLWLVWRNGSAALEAQWQGVTLAITPQVFPALVAIGVAVPVALRSGAPRIHERTQFFVVAMLFVHALMFLSLLLPAPLLRLSVGSLVSVPLLSLVALFGGPERGTTAYRTALVWLGADIAGLAGIAFLIGADGATTSSKVVAQALLHLPTAQQPYWLIVLLAPGLVRLAAGPFSVWLQGFLDEAPVSAAVVACAGLLPMGVVFIDDVVAHNALASATLAGPSIIVFSLAAVLAGVISIGERDLRRLGAQSVFLSVAATSAMVLSAPVHLRGIALMHVTVLGATVAAALVTIEAIERRFETRDAGELVGMSASAPILAFAWTLAAVAATGVPGFGAGVLLWQGLSMVFAAETVRVDGTLLLPTLSLATFAIAVVFLMTGVLNATRRLYAPPVARARWDVVRVNAAQALRVAVPLSAALVLGFISDGLALHLSQQLATPKERTETEAPLAPDATKTPPPKSGDIPPDDGEEHSL